jgi:hypothetical protein
MYKAVSRNAPTLDSSINSILFTRLKLQAENTHSVEFKYITKGHKVITKYDPQRCTKGHKGHKGSHRTTKLYQTISNHPIPKPYPLI